MKILGNWKCCVFCLIGRFYLEICCFVCLTCIICESQKTRSGPQGKCLKRGSAEKDGQNEREEILSTEGSSVERMEHQKMRRWWKA